MCIAEVGRLRKLQVGGEHVDNGRAVQHDQELQTRRAPVFRGDAFGPQVRCCCCCVFRGAVGQFYTLELIGQRSSIGVVMTLGRCIVSGAGIVAATLPESGSRFQFALGRRHLPRRPALEQLRQADNLAGE